MLTKAERTKQFILETAAPLFNERGIAGAHIDDVLTATQLTKGCLYGHFENKEDLAGQVVDLLLTKMTGKIIDTISGETTAKAKIFAFLDLYHDPINSYIQGGCPIFNMAVEADDTHLTIKEKVGRIFSDGQQLTTAILQQGIEDGEFSDKLDPAAYAFKLVAAVEGGVVMCRVMNTVLPMYTLIKNLKQELESYAS